MTGLHTKVPKPLFFASHLTRVSLIGMLFQYAEGAPFGIVIVAIP